MSLLELRTKLKIQGEALKQRLNSPINLNNIIKTKILATLLPQYQDIYNKIIDSGGGIYLVKGGRQSSKTWGLTQIMLLLSLDENFKGTQFINLRKYQNKVEMSVYSVYRNHSKDLSAEFDFKKDKANIGYASHLFLGCRDLNAALNLKGLDNVGAVFIEEAEGFSEATLEVLNATFRRRDKKAIPILIALNPFKPIDDVIKFYKRYNNYHEYHINIFDLPPEVQDPNALEQAAADLKIDEEYFSWKWLGKPYPSLLTNPFANIFVEDWRQAMPTSKIYAFLDPSFKGLDSTALSICWLEGERIVVYGICWFKAWNEAITLVLEQLRRHNVDYFYYEDNCLGSIVADVFYDGGVVAEPHTNKKNKLNRIYKVAPLISTTTFLKDSKNRIYFDQLAEFGEGAKNDDAPDSLASCLHVMEILRF